jgi:hypothetical protein
MTVGELGHLKPPCREAALLTDAERIHWLRQERWIQYPRRAHPGALDGPR